MFVGDVSPQTGSCSNILLERMKASRDADMAQVTLKYPVLVKNKYCKFHWNTSGTCCDEAKLTAALPKYLDKWVDDLQSFTIKVNDFQKIIKENNWKIVNRMISLYKWADDTIKKGNHKFTVNTMKILKK